MLFQDALTQRIIVVLIVQIWPILYGSYFAYKLIKRAKTRATFSLSTFFILLSLAYLLAAFSIFFLNTPFAYFFYILGIYFFVFSHCFFVIFSWVLVKLDDKSTNWKFRLILIFYGLISTYIFWLGFYFKGITNDSTTNWVPQYSWDFLLFSWAIFLIILVFPQIYFSFKLSKVFEGVILKRRLNMFILAVFLEILVIFTLFLYHYLFDNQVYRTFHVLVMPIISTTAAFLIYKSFGKELE